MAWRALPLVVVSALAAVVLAACSGGGATRSAKIFEAPPWMGPERYEYRVKDPGVDGTGTCVLTTTPQSEPGRTTLERKCSKDQYSDDATVIVDNVTLAPIRSERVNRDSQKGKVSTFTVTYQDRLAEFTAASESGDTNRTERDLPKPSADSPDPGWYDDDELLWLARGIPLQKGWEGGYTHVINAGQPRVLNVSVRVEGPEDVTVPLGRYSAWRVRFERQGTVYYVWVDTAAPNKVVRAQIEDVSYELTAAQPGGQ